MLKLQSDEKKYKIIISNYTNEEQKYVEELKQEFENNTLKANVVVFRDFFKIYNDNLVVFNDSVKLSIIGYGFVFDLRPVEVSVENAYKIYKKLHEIEVTLQLHAQLINTIRKEFRKSFTRMILE